MVMSYSEVNNAGMVWFIVRKGHVAVMIIRIRSHRLLSLVDNKSPASCEQACCKLIVKTFVYKLNAKCLNKV